VLAVQSGSYGAVANVSKIVAQGQPLFLGGADGKRVYISGSQVVENAGSQGIAFQRDGVTVGAVTGIANTSMTLTAVDPTGVAKAMVLSGSAVTVGANSTASPIDFAFAQTSLGQVSAIGSTGVTFGSATGKTLTLSGSTDFSMVHGSTGIQIVQNIGTPTYLTINKNGGNAQITSVADLQLKAAGNDITMQGSSGNDFLTFNNDGSDNAIVTGLSTKNVTIGSGLGNTVLALSGSNVNLNGSTINFKKDGTTYAFVGTSPDAQPLNGIMPATDMSFNLGSPLRRWQNIYTGDLHLRNDRGDYTLIEEEDFLSIRFNKTGKRYKFLLEPVPELDEK
jgi:hypothetical protein